MREAAEHRRALLPVVALAAVVLVLWVLVVLGAHWLDVDVTADAWRSGLPVGVVVGGVLVSLTVAVLARRRPGLLGPVVVAATVLTVTGLATVALHGTRWGFMALHSDSGFRTQAVTRYADSAALADYGYADLSAYYPPAWPWLLGRAADLLGVPGWTVMKPGTLLASALVPVLAYLLWRRLLPAGLAALVVLATTLVTADLQKPDEWLVLACLLPWWLSVVRGVGRPEHDARPWVDGVVLGLLLLTHTYYFLPLGVATLLGWALDLVRRRRPALAPGRALLVGGIGLLVAAPYWVPMVVQRLSTPADSLQLRWSPRGFDMPPLPLPTGVEELVVLVAVLWVLVRSARDPLAGGLAVALVAAYVTVLGGQWLQSWDIGLLPHKSEALVLAVSAAALVLAVRDLVALAPPHRTVTVLGAVAASALVGVGLWTFTQHWVVGRPALVAQQMRYPDGGLPAGWGAVPSEAERAWGTEDDTPPATRLLETWRSVSGPGQEQDAATVVVSVHAELLATTPLHSFTPWKSIYSHPLGQYERRVALLEDVAACATSTCAADILRDNPFDRVDGVIARIDGDEVVLPMGVDHFPEGWSYHEVRWPLRLLQGPGFRSAVVGDTVVAVVE